MSLNLSLCVWLLVPSHFTPTFTTKPYQPTYHTLDAKPLLIARFTSLSLLAHYIKGVFWFTSKIHKLKRGFSCTQRGS